MRVLVTGSSGRIGRRLCKELLKEDHEVVGLDIKSASDLERDGIVCVEGSLEDLDTVDEAATGVDAVVHLGALMSWLEADAPALFSINVEGTFNVLEVAARQGIERFVFASSGEVYPEVKPTYLPINELHPTHPISYYGMTKLLGEQMAWFYSRKFGLPVVVLRFPHTQDATELLDPDSFFSGPRFFLKSKIRQLRKLGNLEALAILEELDDGADKLLLSRGQDGAPYKLNICDTRDLVKGITQALYEPGIVGQTIGIGPDEPVSLDEAVYLMHEATNLPIVEACLPGDAVSYVTSNSKARELLGFRPQYNFRSMLKEAELAQHKS